MSTASKVIDQLTQPGAAADIKVAGTFVTLAPHVADKDAQAAIDRAQKMAVDVNITWVTPPAAAPATWKPQSWMISASQIRSWIVFGVGPDGTYAPSVDAIKEEAYLSEVTAKGSVAPVDLGRLGQAGGPDPGQGRLRRRCRRYDLCCLGSLGRTPKRQRRRIDRGGRHRAGPPADHQHRQHRQYGCSRELDDDVLP